MSDNKELKPSLVRTGVPFVVGPLVGWLANKGLKVDSVILTMAVSSISGYLYYVGARFLEVYLSPKWGYILGIAKSPAYSQEPAPSPGPGENIEAIVVPEEPEFEERACARCGVVKPSVTDEQPNCALCRAEEQSEEAFQPLVSAGPAEVTPVPVKKAVKRTPAKKAPAKTQQIRSVPIKEARKAAKKVPPKKKET